MLNHLIICICTTTDGIFWHFKVHVQNFRLCDIQQIQGIFQKVISFLLDNTTFCFPAIRRNFPQQLIHEPQNMFCVLYVAREDGTHFCLTESPYFACKFASLNIPNVNYLSPIPRLSLAYLLFYMLTLT